MLALVALLCCCEAALGFGLPSFSLQGAATKPTRLFHPPSPPSLSTPSTRSAPAVSYHISNVQWSNCDGRDYPFSITEWSVAILDHDIISLIFHVNSSIAIPEGVAWDNGTFAGYRSGQVVGLEEILLIPYQLPIAANSAFMMGVAVQWTYGAGHWDGRSPFYNEEGLVVGCLHTAYDISSARKATQVSSTSSSLSRFLHPTTSLVSSHTSSSPTDVPQYKITAQQFAQCPGSWPLSISSMQALVTGGDGLALIVRATTNTAMTSAVQLTNGTIDGTPMFSAGSLRPYLVQPDSFPIPAGAAVTFVEQEDMKSFGAGGVASFTVRMRGGDMQQVACVTLTFEYDAFG